MARGTHYGLHYHRKSYFFNRGLELLICRGKTVGRCGQPEFFCGEAAYAFAVHGKEGRTCGRCHVVAFFLQFYEGRSGYGLDFWDDVVGLLLFYNLTEGFAVEHIEHIRAVCYLHGGCVGVLIAGDDFNAEALQFDCDFFAELATAEE